MIVDVNLIVFNCRFSRAVTLNRCFIDDIMSSHQRTYYFIFFEKMRRAAPAVSQRTPLPVRDFSFHGRTPNSKFSINLSQRGLKFCICCS